MKCCVLLLLLGMSLFGARVNADVSEAYFQAGWAHSTSNNKFIPNVCVEGLTTKKSIISATLPLSDKSITVDEGGNIFVEFFAYSKSREIVSYTGQVSMSPKFASAWNFKYMCGDSFVKSVETARSFSLKYVFNSLKREDREQLKIELSKVANLAEFLHFVTKIPLASGNGWVGVAAGVSHDFFFELSSDMRRQSTADGQLSVAYHYASLLDNSVADPRIAPAIIAFAVEANPPVRDKIGVRSPLHDIGRQQ
jgi:hypothetical protein